MEGEKRHSTGSRRWSEMQEVKKVVRSLVIAHKDGVNVRQLCEEYRDFEGRSLPFREFGFQSENEFLLTFGDVIRFGLNKRGERVVFAVADQNDAHIQTLVKGQRDSLCKPMSYPSQLSSHSMRKWRAINTRKLKFIPSDVRKNIAILLEKHVCDGGLHLTSFLILYENKFDAFDFELFGFNDLRSCLNSIPNVCTVINTGSHLPKVRLVEKLSKHLKAHKGQVDAFETYFFGPLFEKLMPKLISGLSASDFLKEYAAIYHEQFDPTKWGYGSPIEVFMTIPSLVTIVPSESDFILFDAKTVSSKFRS